MPRGYVWFIRAVLLVCCIAGGWAFYTYLVLNHITVRGLSGRDWLAIIGLSFGIYATIQIILRYVSVPNPRITIADRQPHRLGPTEAQAVPADESEEVRQNANRLNLLRQFAVHHVKVWNLDVPWPLRPLMQRTVLEGCQIRFRYTRIDDAQEQLMLNGSWLLGRWDDNPQPITDKGFDLNASIVNRRLAKLFPTENRGHVDAYPFTVAFAMKKEGDRNFYHFNDESYQWGFGWRNPRWEFDIGTYRVEVRLTGYGLLRAVTTELRLINKGTTFDDLVLEKW